ncbi:MAG: extracellular solute-binding protein [Phycisphaerales bacterium]
MNRWLPAVLIVAAIALLVGVPVVARRSDARPPADAATVIIVTPHNEQIRQEFARAFARWHQEQYGSPATVIWNTPGGTSEIRKVLEAGILAALRDGTEPGGSADLFFGGGSYEFDQLKKPLTVEAGGVKRSASVLVPVEFEPGYLDQVYGAKEVGGRALYDPDGYWFGCALSAFGIIYNQPVLEKLGVAPPTEWIALADPRLQGRVALVNPAQSGSVATAMETILLREGWNAGWAILRRAAANSRSISASATRAPVEVAQGEAAEAIAIDFYGRFQQQAVSDGGSPGRVGYLDPVGKTAIDPDPIAMLRGAPHPQTARRFIEFALSPAGQRLWQYAPGTPGGPEQYGLRRLPASRVVYERDHERFTDKVDPWTLASVIPNPNPNVRSFVAPLFVATAIENRALLREAWRRIAAHPEYPRDGSVLVAAKARDPKLRAMLEAFDAFPQVPAPGGATMDLGDERTLAAVREGWLRGKWKDARLWDPQDSPAEVLRQRFAQEIAASLRRVIAIDQEEAP